MIAFVVGMTLPRRSLKSGKCCENGSSCYSCEPATDLSMATDLYQASYTSHQQHALTSMNMLRALPNMYELFADSSAYQRQADHQLNQPELLHSLATTMSQACQVLYLPCFGTGCMRCTQL